MSFLDPYEKNRLVSWFTALRLLLWGLILGIAWLIWWLVS